VDCYFQSEDDRVLSFIHREAHMMAVHLKDDFKFTNHGPDPIYEWPEFSHNVMNKLSDSRITKKPICDIITDQKIFNGVGNYLRSELLYRAKIPPFTTVGTLLTRMKPNLQHLIRLCRTIPGEIFQQV
jgi:formamidopyrimidine-DNA glycosylase